MFESLDTFRMAAAMARYAGQKQAIVAENIANADTPGFRARDLPPFETIFGASDRGGPMGQQPLRASRKGHLYGQVAEPHSANPHEAEAAASPNGNQVSLETEMLKSVDAKRQHDRALAIYKTSLTIIRSALQSR